MNRTKFVQRVIKPAVFLAALIPFALILIDGARGELGANPIEEITHRTGKSVLTLLMITLAVTPVRKLSGWSSLIKLRRMLGLFAFFYATLHLSTYVVLDQFFSFSDIVDDVAKRPYITVGFTSFLLLVPLALTSTNKMVKRLGGKRWSRLHRLVYVAAAGGVLHFLWQVKADLRTPVIYGGVLVLLLSSRLWIERIRVKGKPGRQTVSSEPPTPRPVQPRARPGAASRTAHPVAE